MVLSSKTIKDYTEKEIEEFCTEGGYGTDTSSTEELLNRLMYYFKKEHYSGVITYFPTDLAPDTYRYFTMRIQNQLFKEAVEDISNTQKMKIYMNFGEHLTNIGRNNGIFDSKHVLFLSMVNTLRSMAQMNSKENKKGGN
jgi:hypothetical protein